MAGKVLVPTLLASAGLGFVGGKVIESAVDGGSDDNEGINQAQENYKSQLEQYKILSDERRKDLERLQKELEETTQKIKINDEEMDRLRAIINDPNRSEDEKNDARKKLITIEGENEDLKRRLRDLEDKIKKVENDKPSTPTLSIP
jgi:predicted RNase H-like nuclease (RuvC/YqgF family)